MPAACVRVAKATPRRRSASSSCQSSTKPADGGSNATGGPAIGVHTSQSASGSATCAYWIGRPWRARPAQIASACRRSAISTRRGWPSSARAPRPRAARARSRSPGAQRRRRAVGPRCACGSRRAEDDGAKALRRRPARASGRPASRTSIARAARHVHAARGSRAGSRRRWRPPGRRAASNVDEIGARRASIRRPSASTTSRRASRGRWTARSAAIMACSSRPSRRASRSIRADDLARRVARPLQRRRVGVGHGERVQRRVHVARVDGEEAHAVRPRAPRPRSRLRWRSAALLAPYAPQPGRVDRRVARDVEHQRGAAAPRAPTRRARRAAPWSGGTARAGWWRAPPRGPRSRCRRAAPAAPGRGSRRC